MSRRALWMSIACTLAACGHHAPLLEPNVHTAVGPPVSSVVIRWHCGIDKSVNEAPPGHDTPIYVTENAGCPSNDGLSVEYLVDVKLLAAGYAVYPTTDDFRKVVLDDADRPEGPPLRVGELSTGTASEIVDGQSRRVFKLFHDDFDQLSANDRAHIHDQFGIDGVAQVNIVGHGNCLLCADLTVAVSVTMYSLADYQPIWEASCQARSSDSKQVEFLVDEAAKCAVERIPARAATPASVTAAPPDRE